MKIGLITINHMDKPLGFDLSHLHIEFVIEATQFERISKQLIISKNNNIIYQTDYIEYEDNVFEPELKLSPRTRYDVTVLVKHGEVVISKSTYFETGKMDEPFTAKWIVNKDKDIQNTLFRTDVTINKEVKNARLYMTALGVYDTYVNNHKVGNEYLAPGQTAYDQWVQIQTYDVTGYLSLGKNELLISVADGWYKGAYGFTAGVDCIYGDQHRALAEYHIEYVDGTKEIILTNEAWQTTSGKVTCSAIYYGADLDERKIVTGWQPVQIIDASYQVLSDRLSSPLVAKEELAVQEVIYTPKGETVLDFGQNHAGVFAFYNREPKGTRLYFQVAEILQDSNFYRENFRTARAAFEYISDGEEKWVEPPFTYFGYRYLKVEGNTGEIQLQDYKAKVIYSDMKETGSITTNNDKVNRLFKNVLWGQKSNFVDVPTDCPQRDERLGWTGDANVFSNTALFNMDAYAFYRKYLKDIAIEQEAYNGRAPFYAPSFHNKDGGGAIWGDATTFIPWNVYQMTGDKSILREHYASMKAWVEWIHKNSSSEFLWTGTFQFGDWLALDGGHTLLPKGATDEVFIASICYYHSTHIVAETAQLLELENDFELYSNRAQAILNELQKEYLTQSGRLAIDTQTAYAIALHFSIVPEHQVQRVTNDLVDRLKKDNNQLKTGFVGTPFINQVLSKHGYHRLATEIFLNEASPSWLYAVNLGATTIWERWDSVYEDGTIQPDGMNSLNHYSFGAIMEWAYKNVLGIQNFSEGFKKFDFSPQFDQHLKEIEGHFDCSYGRIKVKYQIEADDNHTIKIDLTIPFGSKCSIKLPRSEGREIIVNNQIMSDNIFILNAGKYHISYIPNIPYIDYYDSSTTLAQIMSNPYLVEKIDKISPVLDIFKVNTQFVQGKLGKSTLKEIRESLPYVKITDEELEKIQKLLEITTR